MLRSSPAIPDLGFMISTSATKTTKFKKTRKLKTVNSKRNEYSAAVTENLLKTKWFII
jgi:hypothetical protein